MEANLTTVALLALLACALLAWSLHVDHIRSEQADPEMSRRLDALDNSIENLGCVDPWRLQRALMRASEQRCPPGPIVTDGALLYHALILEESAEMGTTLRTILARRWEDPRWPSAFKNERAAILRYLSVCHEMRRASLALRALLAEIGPFEVPIDRAEARQLLDDTTDVQVVNSGFAIAVGLPAEMGYLAVQQSNLSKRNADGRIAKTPDGKWIKGPNYAPPQLDPLLDPHYPAAQPKTTA